METYATAVLIAIPFFIILIFIEIGYGYFVKKQMHKPMDTISSLSSGLTNSIKDTLGLAVVLVSYPFLKNHLAIFDIQSTWLTYTIGFIAMDFAAYWNHRLNHKVNYFWNQHVIHHSSEEFNLACALRQPISTLIGYFPLFLIPAAIAGVQPEVINIIAPIHLFLQFWYHTRYIGKLGWIEYILVTPSQHRVHHAINKEYIDKNLSAIFCVWDRAFGTFQEELEHIPPVFGVLKPVKTWNPILINFQHLWGLVVDAWRTKNYWDKMRIWFMPTGWRPSDVKESHPNKIVEDVYHMTKYDTKPATHKIFYAAFQLVASMIMLVLMLLNYTSIGFSMALLYAGFVFLSIFGYSSVMDNWKSGFWIELFRSLQGIAWITYFVTGWALSYIIQIQTYS